LAFLARPAVIPVTDSYDVIVIDTELPDGVDGLGVVMQLRKGGNKIPILIVSERTDVDHRILGLKSGADDYLVKPFALAEFLARLDAITRRSTKTHIPNTLTIGDLHVDMLTRKVKRSGKSVELQPREFKLLEYMMRHANQVVTRSMLIENVWEHHFDPGTNVIDVHISKLRKKIGDKSGISMLRTIRNSGYMIGVPS